MSWKRQSLALDPPNLLDDQCSDENNLYSARGLSQVLTRENEGDLLNTLTAFHKRVVQPINWHQRVNVKTPSAPIHHTKRTLRARRKLKNYQPSWLDRCLHLEVKKKARLRQRLLLAEQRDYQAHQLKIYDWQRVCQPLWQRKNFAQRIINGNLEAKTQVLHSALNASPYTHYCTNWSLTSNRQGDNQLSVQIKGLALIPKQIHLPNNSKQLKRRSLTKKERYHLYQQHVVSLALGLANEYFAKLPDDRFHLIAFEERITYSGKRQLLEVLSLPINREQFNDLQLNTMDLIKAIDVLQVKLISQTKLFTVK